MKKIVLGMAMLMAAGGAFAANSHQRGAMALTLQTGETDFISGKYMVNNNVAVVAGLGYQSHGGDSDGSRSTILVGARNYMRNDDMSPFIGGHIKIVNDDVDLNDESRFEVAAEFGAEYFFAKQFSVEGAAMLGFASIDNGGNTDNVFGTASTAIGFNYYF